MEIKSQINFNLILRSDEPNFIALKKDWGMMELAKPVMALTDSFLRSAFPDQAEIASDVALALIDREPSWTLLDVVNFYKTIINRQDLDGFRVFGNKITLLKLMEMVGEYEGLKADERVKVWEEEKQKGREQAADITKALVESGKLNPKIFVKDKLNNPVSIKMGKLLEKQYVKSEKLGKAAYSTLSKSEGAADEKYFAKYTEPDIPIEYRDTPPKPYPEPEEVFPPNAESSSPQTNIEEK